MPQFVVTSPQGVKYQVNGPDGSTQDDAISYVQKNMDTIHAQSPASSTSLGQDAGTVAREGYQGLTAGFGDEAISGAAAVGAKLYDKLSGQNNMDDQSVGELYNQAQASQAQDMKNDYKNSPVLSIGSNLAGSVLTGAAGAKALASMAPEAASYLANSASKTGQILKSGAQGAAQGAIYGAGSADTTNGESRLSGSVKGAVVGGLIGGAGGALLSKEITPGNQALNDAIVSGTDNTKQEIGDQLGAKILQAGQDAKSAKSQAYTMANAVGDNAVVKSPDIHDIADAVDQSVAHLDPELSPAVKQIGKYTQQLRDVASDDTSGVTYNGLENLRQRINAIPYTPENSAAKSAAKSSFDSKINDLFQQGLIDGDQSALDLIKDARSKNTYWQQAFNSKDANNVIRNYVKSQGESLTPENLVDKLTSYNQAGFNGVKAVKDVIGPDADDLIKQGFLTKIRSSSLDSSGNIVPSKLASNIYKFTSNNSMASQVFSPEEIQSLNALSHTASNLKSAGNITKLTQWVGSKIPIVGDMVSELSKQAKLSNVSNQLSNAGQKTNYPTLASKFIGVK